MLFPFAEIEKKAKKMSIAELYYAKDDCFKASKALRGCNCKGKDENYYADEGFTYSDEIRRRQKLK